MKSKKEGFTLVEILIVIAIIGMLSTVAIGGYTSYRKAALINLNADNFVAQILKMKGDASRGNFDSIRADQIRDALGGPEVSTSIDGASSDAKCFGIGLEKGDNGYFNPQILSWDFSNRKVYELDEWVYVGCDQKEIEKKNMEIDEMVHIDKVSYFDFNGAESEITGNVSLQFSPPDGKIALFDDGREIDDLYLMEISMKYGESADPRYMLKVLIDLKSFTVTVNGI